MSMAHCPFDRLWRPGHPFRPRRSKRRGWTMAGLFIFFCAFISSYFFLTDPARIKSMSQFYLWTLVHRHVEIGSAKLTVFEGLVLNNVVLKVDEKGTAPDTTLFTARTIDIQYNPASLLRGRLEATRIIATGAKVNLVESSPSGHWNFQRLLQTGKNPRPGRPAHNSQ